MEHTEELIEIHLFVEESNAKSCRASGPKEAGIGGSRHQRGEDALRPRHGCNRTGNGLPERSGRGGGGSAEVGNWFYLQVVIVRPGSSPEMIINGPSVLAGEGSYVDLSQPCIRDGVGLVACSDDGWSHGQVGAGVGVAGKPWPLMKKRSNGRIDPVGVDEVGGLAGRQAETGHKGAPFFADGNR